MGSNKRKSLFIDSLTLSGDVSAQAEENEASVSAQLKKLESEINIIKAKLADLMTKKETLAKRLAELHEDDIIPPPLMDSYPVPVFSNGIEKAQFLLDLFSPRTDVFAKRGRSQSKKVSDITLYVSADGTLIYARNKKENSVAISAII